MPRLILILIVAMSNLRPSPPEQRLPSAAAVLCFHTATAVDNSPSPEPESVMCNRTPFTALCSLLLFLTLLASEALAVGELHQAVRNEDLELVTKILKKNPATVRETEEDKTTPLHAAVDLGSGDSIVMILLQYKADPNARNEMGETPLHIATKRFYGGENLIRQLLRAKANVNARTNDGTTPLMNGHMNIAIVRVLLDGGAEINATDSSRNTVLHMAAQHNDGEIMSYLLSRGANIEAVDGDGSTALHRASGSGYADNVDILLGKGADPNARDESGDTPLHYCANAGWKIISSLLLAAKADINARNNDGATPLHIAVGMGQTRLVEFFLASGAAIESKNEEGQTPLHYAAINGAPGTAEILLKAGANINAADNSDNTPLYYAAAEYPELASFLRKNGAK
jgi:ankyrin repeat protein